MNNRTCYVVRRDRDPRSRYLGDKMWSAATINEAKRFHSFGELLGYISGNPWGTLGWAVGEKDMVVVRVTVLD